ncbi:MAG TPA: D-2-hydroxyacid dehydrogenase [Trueperaceae bacterium]|nr:D-2-hydroxyacid dehydrogenase [Trueperaceae bacterium]
MSPSTAPDTEQDRGTGAAVLLVGLREDALSAEQLRRIAAAAPDMRVVVTRDRATIESLLPDVRIVAGQFPHDLLPGATSLEWFQQWGAGADWLLRFPAAVDMPFVLTNASGVHAVPISEHVMTYLLAFARGLPTAIGHQGRADWRPLPAASVFELKGKTLLLVGAGAIGERIARLAAAFEMRVVVVRRDPSRLVQGAEAVYADAELSRVLPEADFVVVTAPLTAATRGMFGTAEFRAMKRSAYLVNIGRGAIVKEAELAAALRDGTIAGAGLDVFEHEPLAADSPLWGLGNVIITAHYSGATPSYTERALAIFLDNLERFRKGKGLINVVDKHKGY